MNKKTKFLTLTNLLILILPFVTACSNMQREQTGSTATSRRRSRSQAPASFDKVKLAKDLRIYRKRTDIGFEQATFNDCSLPREYRKQQGCSTQYLAVVNFRMRCRDSKGTVNEQVSNYELTPLQSNSLKWNVGKLSGYTKTDSRGFGQVIVRSHFSMAKKQFRLFSDNHVMGVSAEEVRQFVLPNYWCE